MGQCTIQPELRIKYRHLIGLSQHVFRVEISPLDILVLRDLNQNWDYKPAPSDSSSMTIDVINLTKPHMSFPDKRENRLIDDR